MHEIRSLIAPSFKSRYVRLAQLHLRIAATLLAMRTAHPTYEVGGIVKSLGQAIIPNENLFGLTPVKHLSGYA